MKPTNPLAPAAEALTARADDLERWGASAPARALRTAAEEVQAAWDGYWNAPLDLAAAREWSGYSLSQLRRLRKEGKLMACPDGRILRRHLPVVPGHRLPIGTPGGVHLELKRAS